MVVAALLGVRQAPVLFAVQIGEDAVLVRQEIKAAVCCAGGVEEEKNLERDCVRESNIDWIESKPKERDREEGIGIIRILSISKQRTWSDLLPPPSRGIAVGRRESALLTAVPRGLRRNES